MLNIIFLAFGSDPFVDEWVEQALLQLWPPPVQARRVGPSGV